MESALQELKQRLAEVTDLERALSVLGWDMSVWMPPGGVEARGHQLAAVETLAHERFVDERVGELLTELEPYAESLPHDADDACLIRVARRDWDKARRIPTSLKAEFARVGAESYEVWVRAREASDFPLFQPLLERMLDLRLQLIECFAPYDDPYDVALDDYEPGMKTTEVEAVLDVLEPALVSFVAEHATDDEDPFMSGPFDVEAQKRISLDVIQRFGASLDEFRLDTTIHPFATKSGQQDIRLTTRYSESDLHSLFSAMHEVGHGLYEHGISPSLDRTPLCDGVSSTLHESQSRLWENLVGRSLPFWHWLYPTMQEAFPKALGAVPVADFHRAVNRVSRSFIRVDSDETTYGLHIILRFGLERRLLSGELAVRDLPDAWNTRFEELMGIPVPDDRSGVLQDVHWSDGSFGYFPTYQLGNVVAVQIWEKVAEAIPDLEEQIGRGEFSELHTWLLEHLYTLGRKFTPAETLQRVAGGPIDPQPYLRYLRAKAAGLSR